ncbi:MAG: conjugative transposon protein TraM [Rikenellaceae bacterium]
MSEIEKRPISPEKRKRIEQAVVYLIAGLIGLVVMWIIFAPESGKDTSGESSFNASIPEAVQEEMSDDKQKVYEKQRLSEKDAVRQEIKTLADNMLEEQLSIQQSTPKSSSRNSSNATPQENVEASNVAMKEMNQSVMTFYDRPKVDTEKQKMQEELDMLKEQLSQQQKISPTMSVDEQMAIVEKSYELAAKYMPGGESREAEQVQPTEEERYINGKAVVNNIGFVEQKVVSSLGATSSAGFNTAVGREQSNRRNTISACIHSDQTIIDGGAVRLRLLEPMMAGDYTIPQNATISGYGKVSGERLAITITNIEHQGLIVPVELSVVDSDGQSGIFIPNSMELNAFKEVVANLGANVGTSIDINEQDALNEILTDLGEGAIQGVSQYVSKKLKQEKVHLKAGYKVMLYQKK